MTSTIFVICLILAAVMVLIHPALCIPFIIVAYLLAKKSRMDMDSGTSIISGVVFFILFLVFMVCFHNLLK
ncbi:hypothetical protein [Serratia fonticola]